ncbi:MAG: 5-(carboxyamino)imidazole ribonucleotide mutase [Candidatus Cloacimonadaceae bacterium]
MDKPLVRIIIGSKSDLETCKPIQEQLKELGVESDFYVSSAHRNPVKTMELVHSAEQDGIKVFIACAGMAAHLPGVIASHTTLPVIGVPLKGSTLSGEDALYSIVQMPPGVPVATVAINGTKNAAVLAAQILALSEQDIKDKLIQYKKQLANN